MKEETPLKVTFSEEQNCHLIEVGGEISYSVTSLFQEKIEIVLKEEKKNILIDLSQVTYISSAGLRVLLKFGKDASAQDKNLALCGLNEFVSSVFKVSGFDKIFNIQPERSKAIEFLLKETS